MSIHRPNRPFSPLLAVLWLEGRLRCLQRVETSPSVSADKQTLKSHTDRQRGDVTIRVRLGQDVDCGHGRGRDRRENHDARVMVEE